MEIWKDITGYESLYQVSNLGNVKSLGRQFKTPTGHNCILKERILKASIASNGYKMVSLYKDRLCKKEYVHKLIAIMFLNHKPNGYTLVVNHKNFIKTDNRVDNLEIITNRENTNLKHLKSSSKFVGVSWSKSKNKWRADIRIKGKGKCLGFSNCEIKANELYIKALNEITNPS